MTTRETSMTDYYARRASEYERIYKKPERQTDLNRLKELLSNAFPAQNVLEIACGTGYWTQFIARSAKSILATDYSAEVLDIARQKDYGSCRVQFVGSDAYFLANVTSQHEAGFHGFWWSHIAVHKLQPFLHLFHSKLSNGAKVIIIDNAYVEGSSTPISRRDAEGSTYQIRKLKDGSEHEILKNFPTPTELQAALEPYANGVTVAQLQYFWIAECNVRKAAEPTDPGNA